MKLLLPILLLISSFSLFAKAPKTYQFDKYIGIHDFDKNDGKVIAKLEADLKKLKKRKVASQIDGESLLSSDFKKLRTEFLAIKTTDALDAFLAKIDSNYDSYSDDTRYWVAQLAPLKKLKGIVYRVRPYFEKENASHTVILSAFRTFAKGIDSFLPTKQWKVGMKYVTAPVSGTSYKVTTDNGLKGILSGEIYPAMSKMRKRIYQLSENVVDSIVWDNKLYYGTGAFVDGVERYTKVTRAELAAVYTSIALTQANLSFAFAYNWDGALKLTSDIGHLYGVDGFAGGTLGSLMGGQVEGAPSRDRVATIKAQTNLLKKASNAPKFLKESLTLFKYAARYGKVSYQYAKKNTEPKRLLNVTTFSPWNTQVNKMFDNLYKLVTEDTVSLRSTITGAYVKVNFKKFFTEPMNDVKNFLPTKFNKEAKTKTLNNKSYRNYLEGSATAWNYSYYQKYFPSLKQSQKNGKKYWPKGQLEKHARILSQSIGGVGVSGLLAGMIL